MPGTRTGRARVRRSGLFVIAAAVVAVVALPSVAGAAKKPKTKTVMNITVGDQAVYGVGDAPQALPDDVRNQVMTALTAYVTAATVTPLQKGAVDNRALANAFDLAVIARSTGTDRTVLVDDGMPKAKGKIIVTAQPVKLTGLADGGKFVVVTAALDAMTTAQTKKGRVTIHRSGDLVFSPDASGWKVSGYDLKVDRVGKPFVTPTTATTVAAPPAAATTPGTKAK